MHVAEFDPPEPIDTLSRGKADDGRGENGEMRRGRLRRAPLSLDARESSNAGDEDADAIRFLPIARPQSSMANCAGYPLMKMSILTLFSTNCNGSEVFHFPPFQAKAEVPK